MTMVVKQCCACGQKWESPQEMEKHKQSVVCPACGENASGGAGQISNAIPRTPRTPGLPRQFGRYQLLKQLGKGGMGAVYLAFDPTLDRQVALKIPHFGADDDPHRRERFFREARAAATLHDPGICPVFEVGEVNGTPYVTMAYIEGRPLSIFCTMPKPLSPKQAVVIVRKLARAMAVAHAQGVIHRDLKPANVTINRRGEPVIIDFGIAWRTRTIEPRLTQDGAILGTPAYMAPEQLEGDPEKMSPSCDIYSLGVLLYELLTQRLPYPGPSLAIVAQILTQPPTLPRKHRPELDAALEALCLKALAKEPASRFRSMNEMAEALGQYLRSGAAAEASENGPLPLPPASSSREELQVTINGCANDTDPNTPAPMLKPLPTISLPPVAAGARMKRPWFWAIGGSILILSLFGVMVTTTLRGDRTDAPNLGPAPQTADVKSLSPLYVRFDVGELAEAIVLVDGKVISREVWMGPLALPRGEHEIAIMVDGEVTQRTQVVLQQGEVLRIQLLARKTAVAGGTQVPAKEPQRPAPTAPMAPTARTNPVAPTSNRVSERPQETKPQENKSIARRLPPSSGTAPFDSATARQLQHQWATYLELPVELVNSRNTHFALIPPGSFTMGAGNGRSNDASAHEVQISRPHYIGLYEVTQSEYELIMGRNPSAMTPARMQSRVGGFQFRFGPQRGFATQSFQVPDQLMRFFDTRLLPVENVKHAEAEEFCRRLSELPEEKSAGRSYRLPTEAEWEYACRAGSETLFANGDQLTAKDANFDADGKPGNSFGGSPGCPTPVGSYRQNAFGLCDMHGNVWEWCADGYVRDYFENSPIKDPYFKPKSSSDRVRRGGSWASFSPACQSHARSYAKVSFRDSQTGFRVVCDINPATMPTAQEK